MSPWSGLQGEARSGFPASLRAVSRFGGCRCQVPWKAKPSSGSSAPGGGGRPAGTLTGEPGIEAKPPRKPSRGERAAGCTAPGTGVANHSDIGQMLLLRLPALNPAGAGGPMEGLGVPHHPWVLASRVCPANRPRATTDTPQRGFPWGIQWRCQRLRQGRGTGSSNPRPDTTKVKRRQVTVLGPPLGFPCPKPVPKPPLWKAPHTAAFCHTLQTARASPQRVKLPAGSYAKGFKNQALPPRV